MTDEQIIREALRAWAHLTRLNAPDAYFDLDEHRAALELAARADELAEQRQAA